MALPFEVNIDELLTLCSYILEENRLSTFKKWIFRKDAACSAEKLAEAGFIFVGSKKEPDTVQCFLCHKTLDGWDEDDDPWSEHLKHAPYCNFAKLHTKSAKLTFDQYLIFKNEIIVKYFDTEHDKIIWEIEQRFEQVTNT